MDLLTLIGRDTPLRKVASTGGGEWAGPCPFCGGQDRFRVQPERGRWWCRRCSPEERWDDAITYVRRRDGLSFHQAREALGQLPSSGSGANPRTATPPRRAPSIPTVTPSAAWMAAAAEAVERCARSLWADGGRAALRYLRDRGLADDTLTRWKVGFSRGEQVGPLWIPFGIILPWLVDGEVWQLKVRRPRLEGSVGPKYVSVRGGRPHLYGVDLLGGRPYLVLTEGEFDAMLLWQAGSDLADVGTLGSCAGRPSEKVLWRLLPYRTIFLAHDADSAGDEGALRLRSLSARLRRIRPLQGKDLNDFHSIGGSLRDWLRYHIHIAETRRDA